MLTRFLAKRMVIPVLFSAALFSLYGSLGPLAALGIFLGAALSLYKVRLFEKFLKSFAVVEGSWRRNTFFQCLSLSLVFLVLTASVIADVRLFIGVASGFITLPLVIGVNAITEGFGWTRNGWGQ